MGSVMPIQPSRSSKQGFPLRLFAVAFLFSLLATVFGGWQTWQIHEHSEEASAKHKHIIESVGRIMLFDEVLTMSALMAAATGDFSYEKRYDQFDPLLTTEINAVRAMLPQAEIEHFVRETDEANLALVKMERQAFALAHQGRRQEATALLTGDEYLRLKKVYAGGMETTAAAVRLVFERDGRHLRSLAIFSMVANFMSILVLLAVWFFAAKSARSWAAERREAEDALRKARDELEVRVEQRTADLLDANEQLQHEITERKLVEAALRESEERFRKISESAQEAIIMMGADQRISFWNAAAERLFGYTAAEALGQELHALIIPLAAQAASAKGIRHFIESGEGPVIGKVIELAALRKGGEEFLVELSVSAIQLKGQWHAIGMVRDITERKQIEAAQQFLAESGYQHAGEHFFQALAEFLAQTLAMDYVCIDRLEGDQLSAQTVAIYFDGKFEDNVSYTLEDTPCGDVVAKKVCCFAKDVRRLFPQDAVLQAMLAESYVGTTLFGFGGKPIGLIAVISRKPLANPHLAEELLQMVAVRAAAELERQKSEGELQEMLRAANQSRRALLSVIQDQKRTEVAIEHANRALATLSAVNRNLVHATDEDELLQAICDAIVEQRGYRLAWVGYKQHDESKSIRIMARAGHDEGYLDGMQLTWSETERGIGPSGRAIRSGATQLCQDIANDPLFLPWRDAALQRGYAGSIALPLLNGNGEVFAILNVYAGEANAFAPNEIDLLKEMAGDLAFGVLALHTRRERDLALVKNQQQLIQLQDSLEDTVRAMAGLVEMRDPYTAGHQARVADLAAAIAKQMGLPDEQVHAIHLAGTVHDLGKINIPAEILSKPGKITDIDFNLIKTHPQAGYDILQGIDFPWPIALMVLQHHERLDGSGYPQGLKGEAILLEARILSVADVVEAITAHRPYRPGLGIEVALEEITKNRGIFYGPQVVDACLRVINENGFVFST